MADLLKSRWGTEDGSKSNPTSSLRIGFRGHILKRSRNHQAWAPHPRWEASLPAGRTIQGQTQARGVRLPAWQPWDPRRNLSQKHPRHLEICPQLKAHLQGRVPGKRSKGRKWMEGTGPHLILISFWGFSNGKKPFKRKGPFLFLLAKWEAGFIEKTSELRGPREPRG